MRRISLAVVACALALSGCASDPPGGAAASAESKTTHVTIEAIAFDPAELEVHVGDTVTWTNEDESVKHTVTSGKPGDRGVPGLDNAKPDKPDGVFDGTVATAGDTFEFTFERAGTYDYFCRVHPVMTATIIVSD